MRGASEKDSVRQLHKPGPDSMLNATLHLIRDTRGALDPTVRILVMIDTQAAFQMTMSSPSIFCPNDRTKNIDAINRVISGAKRFIYVSIMDYLPLVNISSHSSGSTQPSRYWSRIDEMLREALLLHNIKVRLLISCWKQTHPLTFNFVWSLKTLCTEIPDCSLEVKFFCLTEQKNATFPKINRNKFMVTDRAVYIGNNDWIGNDFTYNTGVGLVISQAEAPSNSTIVEQLKAVFERDWYSRHAKSLQANKIPECIKQKMKHPAALKLLSTLPSTRILGTHMNTNNIPVSFFEKKSKILVVLRNPKDTAVSYFHFYNKNPALPAFDSWDKFFSQYMSGEAYVKAKANERVGRGWRCLILVVLRNPKDTAVSYFHFYNKNPALPAFDSWDKFFSQYMSGEVMWGSYFDHAVLWEKYIDSENVKIVTYEDLKANFTEEIKEIAKYFNYTLSDEQIQTIAEESTFDAMKEKSQEMYGSFGKVIFRKVKFRLILF
ncbi:UNVERIFIED_CONTAM: hypothetical protein FKN15_006122 [Acipenser sinensis]